jgi:two-component system sensor histidine kinase RpfC
MSAPSGTGNTTLAPPGRDNPGNATQLGRSLVILVAEDNRINQKVTAKILERAGHRAHIAEDGELALDALEHHAFDLVLLDLNMPVMNGFEVAKLYRFMSLGEKRLPIVALTGDVTPEISRRCEEAGMDACLGKPIEPSRLLEAIAALVPAAPAAAPVAQPRAAAHGEPAQGSEPVIDEHTLDALAELGGKDFVAELASQFVGDTAAVLRDLAAAANRGDARSFREQAHALRSAAANIGARRIYEACMHWRKMPTEELERNGARYLEQLKAEFDEVRAALRDRLPASAAAGTGTAPSLTLIRGGRNDALAS